MDLLKYYSRRDVKKAISTISENREISVKFGDNGFGKRPDVIQFDNDVYEFAKKGATSFHISEELWNNPLSIKTGMQKRELDELRKGWDLILDVDGLEIEYSKLTSYYLVEALKFYDIKNISVKYSGNKGFHIAIPFETFPKRVNNIDIKNFFPEGPRIIALYLKNIISEHLSKAILEKETINDISKKINKPKESLIKNKVFDPFVLAEIDSVLISSRHLFRAPYSYNEKSGLISIPININNILDFDKKNALMENVKVDTDFLNRNNIKNDESSELFDKAIYWNLKNTKKVEESKDKFSKEYDPIKKAINESFFPPCIKIINQGIKEDGKKRALFILLNYLNNVGYGSNEIESFVLEWNKKNSTPLHENYIRAQLSWQKRQEKKILPPNCPAREENIPSVNQQNYYLDLGICKPDDFCKFIKNPVNYAIKKQRLFEKK